MAAARLTGMRCIGCKTETREGDEVCRKCGDRVAPRRSTAPAMEARRARLELVVDDRATPVLEEFLAGQVVADASRYAPDADPAASDKNVAQVTLTTEQYRAIDAVRGWYAGQSLRSRSEMPFRLFGPAGTGKTTLARSVGPALGLDNVVFGAYTGKAAHVLRRKDVPATTIHSAVYKPVDNYEVRAEWRRLTAELASINSSSITQNVMRSARLIEEIEALEATMRRPSFEFNPHSDWADADLIVLDEVSMVNANMAADIERFGVPVLVLGDPEQLPPIEGGGYYTATQPDVLLTEVHRQALQSPVYRLATQIREGKGWSPVPVSLAAAMEADQVICWKNSTRWNLITKMRQKLGRPKEWPVIGDRIMCLVNNKDAGILNGQQFDVLAATREGEDWMLSVRDDEGHEREVLAYPDGFLGFEREKAGRDTLRAYRGERGLFTFANVVTCHKAQGSEWDHVYVVDQTHQMWKSSEAEKRRWAYTAVSRASERVTIARAGA
jgi:exodeoxyribonuclease-5